MKSDRSCHQSSILRFSLTAILIASLTFNIKFLLRESRAAPMAALPTSTAKLTDKAIKAEIEKKEFELAQLRATVFFLFKPVIHPLNITFLESGSLNCFSKSPGPVIVVESRLEHGTLRNMIRDRIQYKKNSSGGTTNGSSKKDRASFRMVFFVGRVPATAVDLEEAIKREVSVHKDIIQGRYDDGDAAMKTLSMLKWLQDYCWRYHYIIQLHEDAMVPAERWTSDVFNMLKAMKLASEEFDHFVMAGARRQKLGSGVRTASKMVGYTRSTVSILLQAGIRLDEPSGTSIDYIERYSSMLNVPFILDGSFEINDIKDAGRGFLFS